MNLKETIGRKKKTGEIDVDIVPVMNIFLLLIPFLLLTAAFVQLAIVEISLPQINKSDSGQIQNRPTDLVLVLLDIKEDGFQLKSPGYTFMPIANINNKYDYKAVVDQLKQIKQDHPQADEIILSPRAKVKYDIIIKVMDQCRDVGFPNVSLAG